jgi:hypothetical protein
MSLFPDLGKVESQAADDLRTITADAIEHLKTVLNEVLETHEVTLTIRKRIPDETATPPKP